ncbi:Cys/Met metabolism PLP-dependent enzyme-domain-containing protein [Neocallimastix lanati (nom. inval.)]|jgi:cystathionine gamma-lyase|nr:Cys/Met metabolism PLP-dependent enzyme-domain-containing protein [Neocallimastix sp. JGI-2020a]
MLSVVGVSKNLNYLKFNFFSQSNLIKKNNSLKLSLKLYNKKNMLSTKKSTQLNETETVPDMSEENYSFATRAIHVGQEPDPVTGAVIPPISLATTFKQKSAGVHTGFEYSRTGNPTRNNFEKAVASLECAKYGCAFSSGSATTAAIINLLKAGDHVISIDDVYGGTNRFLNRVANTQGIEASFIDLSDPNILKTSIKSNTKLIWIESPTNPTMKIVDIKAIIKVAKEINKDIIVVVDNTFMSPYFQNPITLGADICVNSISKYINGHSDVIMGIALTNSKELIDRLHFIQNSVGAIPSPFDCWLANRGLKTLAVRMRQHEKNAMAVAKFLEEHPLVEAVYYPGLESHKQHELAKKQMKGFGAMMSVRIKGDLDTSNKFLSSLKIFTLAESLGGVECLCELPCIMTHAAVPPEQRAKLGITDTLIRLSVGIEETEDIINDLDQALKIANETVNKKRKIN